jgi:elongation factor 3
MSSCSETWKINQLTHYRGLAVAIKEWGGAVCIISHSTEFVTALCPEIWHVDNGQLTHKGKVALVEDAFDESRTTSRATSKAGTPRTATPGGSNLTSAATSAANSGAEEDMANLALGPKMKKKKKVSFMSRTVRNSYAMGR